MTLSKNLELPKYFEAPYFSTDVFSDLALPRNLSDFVDGETETLDFATVDTNGSTKDFRTVYDKSRSLFPGIRIDLWAIKPFPSDRVSVISLIGELLKLLGEISSQKAVFPKIKCSK